MIEESSTCGTYTHLLSGRPVFKVARFGYRAWRLVKVAEVACTCIDSFYHQGIEIEVIFHSTDRFPSEVHDDFENVAISGHKIWLLTSSMNCTHTL